MSCVLKRFRRVIQRAGRIVRHSLLELYRLAGRTGFDLPNSFLRTSEASTEDLVPGAADEASRNDRHFKALSLEHGELLKLTRCCDWKEIGVTRGLVWITGTPASGDILLGAGQRMKLNGRWPYLVEALEPSDVILRGA